MVWTVLVEAHAFVLQKVFRENFYSINLSDSFIHLSNGCMNLPGISMHLSESSMHLLDTLMYICQC